MNDYRLFIFDLDGTLYRGDHAFPEAVAKLKSLREQTKTIRFLTNNSSQTREGHAAKLRRLGYEADANEIETSATGTAAYLLEQKITSVQCLGEAGLIETMLEAGLQAQGPEETWEEPAEAVVAGIFRQLTYDHLAKAMTMIREGASYVATNADATYPMEGGHFIPGAGAIVAALRTCSEVEPFIVGKPSPFLTQLVLDKAGIPAKETLAVGDRMDTDIESGKAAGCDTLLVLTGVAQSAPPGQKSAKTLAEL